MNTPWHIAIRLALNEQRTFSRFIIRLAIVAVALSTAIMILGSAITRGYQEVIQQKFFDCWGQIHITPFLADPNNLNSYEVVQYDSNLVKQARGMKGIRAVESYTIQSSILKTPNEIEGLLLKGIGPTHPATGQFIVEGNPLRLTDSGYSTDVLISLSVAKQLDLHAGEKALLYFLTEGNVSPVVRKVTIRGIYNTGLEEYDKLFALCDARMINHVRRRNGNSINGYEVYLDRGANGPLIEQALFEHYVKPPLQTYLLSKRFENVFSWLDMMKMNERIIILIMMIIAIINMVTALLILVLERTRMIGILKSLGMQSFGIQSIFIFSSLYILAIGLCLGTLLGVGLGLLQKHAGILHLDEKTYYVKTVPVALDPWIIAGINLTSLAVCAALLIIPSYIIKTISPTRALKFT